MSIKTVLRQVAEVELSKPVSTGLKWSSLAAACTLVFAVQLGVQTLPMLLSGNYNLPDNTILVHGDYF